MLMYRYDGLDASERASGAEAAEGGAPARSAHFSSFFTHAYTATLAAGQGSLCRDFCVFLRGGAFAVFASSALAGCDTQGEGVAPVTLRSRRARAASRRPAQRPRRHRRCTA